MHEFIKWNHENLTGIDSIDDQHKKIINFMDECRTGITQNTKQQTLKKMIENLKNYADEHFGHEEEIFKFSIPDMQEHIKMHIFFKEEIKKMERRIDDNDLMVTEMIIFLKKWFINHIVNEDIKLAKQITSD